MTKNFADQAKTYVKDMIAKKKILVRYMRDEQGSPYGVVVGVKTDDDLVVGHSRCNTKKDNFNRHIGIYIAAQRAIKGVVNGKLDNELVGWYNKMLDRSEKYWAENLVSV